jgi:hypothetical protein
MLNKVATLYYLEHNGSAKTISRSHSIKASNVALRHYRTKIFSEGMLRNNALQREFGSYYSATMYYCRKMRQTNMDGNLM